VKGINNNFRALKILIKRSLRSVEFSVIRINSSCSLSKGKKIVYVFATIDGDRRIPSRQNHLISNRISWEGRGDFIRSSDCHLSSRLFISEYFHSPIDVSVAVAVACLKQLPDTFLVANGARLAFGIRSLRHLLTVAQPFRNERLSVFSPIAPRVITRLPPRHPRLITFRVTNFNSRPSSHDRGGIDSSLSLSFFLSLSLALSAAVDVRLSRDTRRRVSHARDDVLRYHHVRAIRQP